MHPAAQALVGAMQRLLAGTVLQLPDAALKRLVPGGPTRRLGRELDPQLALMLHTLRVTGLPTSLDLPWPQARAALERESVMLAARAPELAEVR